jgi:hypothetical protein
LGFKAKNVDNLLWGFEPHPPPPPPETPPSVYMSGLLKNYLGNQLMTKCILIFYLLILFSKGGHPKPLCNRGYGGKSF